jgi:hypothetical protein
MSRLVAGTWLHWGLSTTYVLVIVYFDLVNVM